MYSIIFTQVLLTQFFLFYTVHHLEANVLIYCLVSWHSKHLLQIHWGAVGTCTEFLPILS